MALIVEDGSIVANANSYVTVQEIKAYAELRGFDLACTQAAIEKLAILAIDYLQNNNYKGSLVSTSQALDWPRQCVYINNELFPKDEIPSQLKNAQIELAIAQYKTNVMNDGTVSDDNIKSEKTDILETQYFEGGKSNTFSSERVNSYLRHLVKPLGAIRI